MARARNLKPGFFVNEYLGTCDPLEALFFEGLWTLADRFGRLENRPLRMKAQIFPYRNLAAQEITGFVQNLSDQGFLTLYSINGQDYIEVCNFSKHQNPHKNEKGGDIPPPPQPPENKEHSSQSSNYESAPEKTETDPDESCIRNHESLCDESLQIGSASDDESPDQAPDDAARIFPLKDGSDYTVSETFVSELKDTYRKLDVEHHLKRARLWLIATPSKRKTSRGMTKFLNGWMSRQKPTAEIHHIQSRHNGFDERDYSEGLIQGVSDDAANF
ncbi:hypothetical protein [uncultured Marinobacter sp.]|mgnify:CR=1 FL=1|uniref:hypothetical protein n=1 Tax=uncultured Marinobacter sp. TaxID=187379 RepID=UPI0030D811DF